MRVHDFTSRAHHETLRHSERKERLFIACALCHDCIISILVHRLVFQIEAHPVTCDVRNDFVKSVDYFLPFKG